MIRTNILFWCLLAILASGMLYHTSYRVQSLQDELDTANEQIAAEKEAIHVLKTEWAYQTAPGRLEPLATKLLGTQRAKNYQIVTMRSLPNRLPLRSNNTPTIMAARSPAPTVAQLAIVKPVKLQAVAKPAPQAMPAKLTQVAAETPRGGTPDPIRNLIDSFGTR